jgi:hypothetical protein
MKTRDRKVTGSSEVTRSEYQTPEVVSMNSTDLLELLGPAQGYGSGGGGSHGQSLGQDGLPGFRKV